MIDFNDVPQNVKKLATGCFLQHLGPKELLALSPPDAAAVAENLGITVEEYIAVIKWLGDYHEKHMEALKHWNKKRMQ